MHTLNYNPPGFRRLEMSAKSIGTIHCRVHGLPSFVLLRLLLTWYVDKHWLSIHLTCTEDIPANYNPLDLHGRYTLKLQSSWFQAA
jgi:hypothetical protein